MSSSAIESYGQVKNPFNIFDPLEGENRGHDSDRMDIDYARGGQMAYVIGPNKEIMHTRYQKIPNDWLGLHQLNVRWDCTNTPNPYGLVLEYWIKDEEGNETVKAIDIPGNADISPRFGNAAGCAFFTENNVYKFVIKSHPTTPDTSYIALDYLKLLPIDMWTVSAQSVLASEGVTPRIQTVLGQYVEVAANGSGSKYTQTFDLPFTVYNYYISYGVYDSLGEITVTVSSNSSTSLTLTANRPNGVAWSGSVGVDLVIVGWVDVIGL